MHKIFVTELFFPLYSCLAPVAGAISEKAGIRLAMALGGALSFGGFCLTSFVQTPSLLFLTVSVMIGEYLIKTLQRGFGPCEVSAIGFHTPNNFPISYTLNWLLSTVFGTL